jgi:hypothetical protein
MVLGVVMVTYLCLGPMLKGMIMALAGLFVRGQYLFIRSTWLFARLITLKMSATSSGLLILVFLYRTSILYPLISACYITILPGISMQSKQKQQ